ncbi:MAG: DUF547 domain-containing protein [Deltaproteobacteria bacterium]|nr:DUF547 domain-containing protein [Myxococcales bacterium]TDJ15699.1 MAG: DUF547 domain-containing protein [Deltaproteobacteria bacterium]TDJ19425.1 MAG: DUF547 domain-containing protein [Deltaproteobacteria bacterium]
MRRRTQHSIAIALLTGLGFAAAAAPAPAASEALNEALYAELLQRYTRTVPDAARVRVDYAAVARSPDWKRLVSNLSRTLPARLSSRDAKLAYWINVYNIFAIDLVARNLPLESIREIGNFLKPVWIREAGRIGGRAYSLDEIEHEILRPMGDPRIHAAIVCAAVSCPALRREPWTAERVGLQLDDAMRSWLADPEKGLSLEPAADSVILSRVFSWFKDDFEPDGGLAATIEKYGPPQAVEFVRKRGSRLHFDYFDYDWNLNDLAATGPES